MLSRPSHRLVGASIALGIEAHSTLPAVSTGVYLAFMIIQLTAIASSWLLLPPSELCYESGKSGLIPLV